MDTAVAAWTSRLYHAYIMEVDPRSVPLICSAGYLVKVTFVYFVFTFAGIMVCSDRTVSLVALSSMRRDRPILLNAHRQTAYRL